MYRNTTLGRRSVTELMIPPEKAVEITHEILRQNAAILNTLLPPITKPLVLEETRPEQPAAKPTTPATLVSSGWRMEFGLAFKELGGIGFVASFDKAKDRWYIAAAGVSELPAWLTTWVKLYAMTINDLDAAYIAHLEQLPPPSVKWQHFKYSSIGVSPNGEFTVYADGPGKWCAEFRNAETSIHFYEDETAPNRRSAIRHCIESGCA